MGVPPMSIGAKVADGVHAVMAVDPGGTTGVYVGWVELKKSRVETLTEGLLKSKSVDVTGDFVEQGRKLLDIWVRFNFACNEALIPISNRHLAIEDFVLRRREEGGATGNLTSCWVAGAFAMAVDMFQVEANISWQQPSDAMTLTTNERLKRWGLWVVGSEHQRAAAKHFVLRVDKLIG